MAGLALLFAPLRGTESLLNLTPIVVCFNPSARRSRELSRQMERELVESTNEAEALEGRLRSLESEVSNPLAAPAGMCACIVVSSQKIY